MVEVAIVAPPDGDDSALVAQIVELVNRVYADAEEGLWRDGTGTGYRPIRTGRLANAYPALQPQLATPCDFVIFRKRL
jgi:hypothetical protein